MYLSEGAKLCIKQILMLWDELGHSPSFGEFDNDERTPRANSLAFYFGSYSDAIAASKPFYGDLERRKELEPKVTPVTPSALLPKGKKKGKNRNAAIQSALTSSVIPKTSQMPSKASDQVKEVVFSYLHPFFLLLLQIYAYCTFEIGFFIKIFTFGCIPKRRRLFHF